MINLVILFLLIATGVIAALRDFRRNFLLIFILILYFVCFFLGPLNSLEYSDYTHLGGNFRSGFNDTMEIYCIGIFCLLVGYFIALNTTRDTIKKRKSIFILNPNYKVYMWLFFFSLVAMIQRNFSEDVYGGGFYNYLTFLGDSLILGFIIIIYEKKFKKPWHWIILVASILCYLVLGFRYRILILIIGVIYHFLVTNSLSVKTIIKWSFLLFFVAYSINFITLNRNALKTLNFQDVQFESKVARGLGPYQLVLEQTNNYKTEMMVVKYMRDNKISYDFGESMFTHIFIRIIPASFFDNSTKPEIPQIKIIKWSFKSKEGRYAGAAVSNVIAYYIAFGTIGVVFFMLLLGITLGYYSKKMNINNARDRVIIAIILMVMFQEITRGYLPQNVTLLIFLLITFKLFYKKQNVSNSYKYPDTI